MRADLHCHSFYSGYANHVRVLHARDCYSAPAGVYRVAKARGMDLVCLTDHDSLDGGLSWLDAHPDATDFILGEEIGCSVPDAPGLRVHLGAVGMTERVHREVQSLRSNAYDVAEYLRGARRMNRNRRSTTNTQNSRAGARKVQSGTRSGRQ